MAELKIVGTFKDYSVNHTVALAEQIADGDKKQSEINMELEAAIEAESEARSEAIQNINSTISNLSDGINDAIEDLDDKIDDSYERLMAVYSNLTQSDIIVAGTLPTVTSSTEDEYRNKIVRVAGNGSYSDYMLKNEISDYSEAFQLMATYNNAIDNVVSDSNNLVTNKAVQTKINDTASFVAGKLTKPYINFHYGQMISSHSFNANIGETIEITNINSYSYYKSTIPEDAISVTSKFVGRIAASVYIALTDASDVVLAVGKKQVSSNNELTEITIPIVEGAVYCYTKTYTSGDWHDSMVTFHVAVDAVKTEEVEVDDSTGILRKKDVLPYTRIQKYIRNNKVEGRKTTYGFYDGNTYYTAVYNVSDYVGKTLNVTYSKYTSGDAIVFCEDYTLIGAWTSAEPSGDIEGWDGNVISCHNSSTVVVPEGAVQMLVCLSSSKMPFAYCKDYDTSQVVLESGLNQVVNDIQGNFTQVANDINTVSNGLWAAVDGSISLIKESTREGLIRDHRLDGYPHWMNRANFSSYIYDVSEVQDGENIRITGSAISNYYAYVFLKSTTLSTAEDWNAAYDSNWDDSAKYRKQVNVAESFSVSVNKPDGALFLVVAKYVNAEEPTVKLQVNEQSIYQRLRNLEEGGSETKVTEEEWVTSERERIEALLESIITHDLVIFGFNTDQHIKASNRDGILRGLTAMKRMAEKYNFDLIVCGGDDTYGGDAVVSNILADIEDVSNTVDTQACPVVNLIGNHDGGQNIKRLIPVIVNGEPVIEDGVEKKKSVWDTTKLNANSMYRFKTQRVVNRKQVVWAAPTGGNFIIDDEVKHCRYVFLDNWSKVDGATEPIPSGFYDNGVWVYWERYTLTYALSDSKLENSDWKVYLFSHNVIAPFILDTNAQVLDCKNLTRTVLNTISPYKIDKETPTTDQHPYVSSRNKNGYSPMYGTNYFVDEDKDVAATNTYYRDNVVIYNSIIQGAKNRGVNIVMAVSGHSHTAAWRSDNGILFASTGSAGESSSSPSFEQRYYKIGVGNTETLFDVYVHDITEQKIYAFAYGAPSDRIWDVSGEPTLLFDNLTVSFDTQESLVGAKAVASYHNTEFEVVADANGQFNFPYLTPGRKWLISITLDGSEEGIENHEYTAVAGTHTLTLGL